MRLPGSSTPPPNRGDFESPTRAPEYRAMLVRLVEARLALGLSQVDVGRRLGRASQFVSRIESGERRLDPIDLWRLAHIYQQPMSAFLPADPPADADPGVR